MATKIAARVCEKIALNIIYGLFFKNIICFSRLVLPGFVLSLEMTDAFTYLEDAQPFQLFHIFHAAPHKVPVFLLLLLFSGDQYLRLATILQWRL